LKHKTGIYAGTFDPVHTGHIAFALEAMKRVQMDKLYFLPERRPRHKTDVSHFGHRVAMLKRATDPYPACGVLELEDSSFSVERTLPRLRKRFKEDQLFLLAGSDTAKRLIDWPGSQHLLANVGLVVGVRSDDDPVAIAKEINAWPFQPRTLMIFPSFAPQVSSSQIRDAIRQRQSATGTLTSVVSYNSRNWLYIDMPRSDVDKP
jgi:nicotinate-nucleotide adenylyltransferase